MKFKNPVSVVSPVDGGHATNKDYVDGKMVTKTWTEYQALSEEEKNNGTLYDIPDMPTGGTDDFLTGSDIATVLDDTVTNKQLVGAETLFNMLKGKNLEYYTIPSIDGTGTDNPLGITDVTLTDIYNKMPKNCMLLLDAALDAANFYGLPGRFFTILWTRRYAKRDIIIATRTDTNEFYICTNIANQTWEKVCTTSVLDVPKTSFTVNSDTTNYEIQVNTNSNYLVRNGVCYVSLCVLCNSPSSSWVELCTIPKCASGNWHNSIPSLYNNDLTDLFVKAYNGFLYARNGSVVTSSQPYYINFSYPVADDWLP